MSISPEQSDDWQRLRAARARWQQADARLYPLAMIDPDWYGHVVQLVGALAAELRRRCDTPAELLAVEADPAALLAAVPDHGSAGPTGLRLDPRMLVEAACALRSGELLAVAQRQRRADAVAAARASGAEWVSVEGSPPTAQSAGERSIEMHLGTGRALVATVDVLSGGDPFVLEEVALDPDTGAFAAASIRAARERTFVDRASWLAAWHQWRGEIDQG